MFACQYGVRMVHFTYTLFTQYQITLRDAVLREASFRFCANHLNMRDAPKLWDINVSDVCGVFFTLIGLHVDKNNVEFLFFKKICQNHSLKLYSTS